jgi:hypothetical protein
MKPKHHNKIVVSTAASNDKKSFLDLPPKIRLKIYHQLLPCRDVFPGDMLRGNDDDNDEECSTTFMRTCQQVYHEAKHELYAVNPMYVYVGARGAYDECPVVRLFGKEMNKVDTVNVDTLQFAGLKHVRGLHLEIEANSNSLPLCAVQSTLFAVLAPLVEGPHDLHSLHASINVSMSRDDHSMVDILRSHAAECYARAIEPSQLSRAHRVAFLTDPIRMIRNLGASIEQEGNGSKPKVEFKLNFSGQDGNPWKSIASTLHDLVQSSEENKVPYDVFKPYFDILWPFQLICWEIDYVNSKVARMWPKLYTARIKGALKSFHKIHHAIVETFEDSLNEKVRDYSDEELEYVRESIDELAGALPKDVDTSKFGFNEIDDALAVWKNQDKEAEKEAKKSEQAEKEAGNAEEMKPIKKRPADGDQGGSNTKSRSRAVGF